MWKYMAIALSLLFYALILPWSVGAAPKARFSALTVDNTVYDVRTFATATSGIPDDGLNDATAFAAALSGGNKTVLIPDGQWEIGGSTRWLSVYDNTTILMGRHAVLNFTGDNTSYRNGFRAFGVSNVTISGGTLIGNRDTFVGSPPVEHPIGIMVTGGATTANISRNILIENVTMQDWKADGILIGGGVGATDNVRVINCKADNVGRSGLTIAGDTRNIYVDGFIGSNTKGFSPEAGMDLEPDLGYSATDITIVNSRFFGNTSHGMYIQSGNGTTTKVTLRNNKAYSNGAYGINISNIDRGLADGNHAWQNTIGGLVIQNSAYWTLTNNILDNNANANIEVNSVTDTVINKNTLINSSDGDGAVVRVNSQRITFTNNIVRANGANGVNIANVYDSAFNENTVSLSKQAGFLIGATLDNSSISRNIITDNRAVGSGAWDGIQSGSAINSTIVRNIVRGAHRYGIWIGPGSDNNIVMFNDLIDAAVVSGSWSDSGKGTVKAYDNTFKDSNRVK